MHWVDHRLVLACQDQSITDSGCGFGIAKMCHPGRFFQLPRDEAQLGLAQMLEVASQRWVRRAVRPIQIQIEIKWCDRVLREVAIEPERIDQFKRI